MCWKGWFLQRRSHTHAHAHAHTQTHTNTHTHTHTYTHTYVHTIFFLARFYTCINDYMTTKWLPSRKATKWKDMRYTNCIRTIIDKSNIWLDLRKAGFHTHNSRTHFSPSNDRHTHILTNNSGQYWCWKLPGLLLLWLVSEACQTSTSAQVTFKWLHIPLTNRQPAVIHHTTGWWV